ncbi:signal peptidase I [Trichococcus ilyis]|uniref:Signal peptidase I n=1 Tax=Trichococcus ilyis TaxID=640938 RepID=A0A143Y9N0_9LACT|nr:signal peptidase I [Trichococcus ilyis]CZQ81578.1 peptidase s26a signal peptidase i lysine active site [Trichococcus ilyis]SEI52597.1 signal peptidase I [Trichococcus ilyis]
MKVDKKIQDGIWDWAKAAFIALLLVVIVRFYVFLPLRVDGDSMSPTLGQGNYILYETFSDIDRFDVIIFSNAEGETLIKRVIGLPGDSVSYKEDQLYLNGAPIDEPFLGSEKQQGMEVFTSDFDLLSLTGTGTVPEGSYFVLGDNRVRSRDSRIFGFVAQADVAGKAAMVYYPFEDFGLIGN